MKVLYIVHANSWDEYSGTPIIADQYAKASLEKGCEVCIVTPTFERIDFKNQKKNSSNDIFFLKWPALEQWSLEAFSDKKYINNEENIISFKPDIIHIIDWVNFNPTILNELKKFKVPIIKHIYNFEDFCYFISPIYKNKDHSYCNAPLSDIECAKCVQSNFFNKLNFFKKIKYILSNMKKKDYIFLKSKFRHRRKTIINHTHNYYDHLIFPSQSFADFYFSHLRENKPYSVISHGIDISSNFKKKNYEQKIKFIFTGGTDLRKGWPVIEEVFDQLLKIYEDKIELRIYGNKKKTEKSKLKKFSSVEFFDAFNPNQIDKILSWADIGVAPTYFETYSRIVREYINFGIVPISTNAFGVSELITSNKNGILIDRPFSKNLFDIVEKIILDTNFLKKLQDGIKNSKIVSKEDEFTKIFQLYNDLIKS